MADAGRRSILVVEDDAGIRLILGEILEGEGYAVRLAPDGVSGLEMALQDPPDVLLLDLMMPEMDGWTVLQERAQHVSLATLPILVMSAGRAPDLTRAKDLGANGYLAKPFDVEVLLTLLEHLVSRAPGRPEEEQTPTPPAEMPRPEPAPWKGGLFEAPPARP